MKYIVTVLILATIGIIAGCSSSSNPSDSGGGTLPTVTANTAVGSPSVTNANDAVWNGVTATSLNVSSANSPKIAVGKGAAVAATVSVQAIVSNDSLFLRLRFADATNSIWRDYYAVNSVSPSLNFTSNLDVEYEDQVFVMFDGGSTFGWDVWNWRALTTDAQGVGGLAEGMKYQGGVLSSDAGNDVLASHNPQLNGTPQPTYVHIDTSEFNGAVLTLDSLRSNYAQTTGWTVGQRVPGWIINSHIKDTGSVPQTQRASRFDIRSASNYNTGTQMYTVVLASKLNTGYADDIDLSTKTSITAKIGIFDDQVNFLTGGTSRGFTGNFTLKLQ